MRVQLDPVRAAQALRTMPPGPKKAMRSALEKLGKDPSGRSVGLDVRRLDADGELAVYRVKVGDWRAAFLVGRDALRVVNIFHRSQGYGWLAKVDL